MRHSILQYDISRALLLIYVLGFLNLYAQEDKIPTLLNLKELAETIKGVTAEKYPDADDVLVDDFLQTTYEATGTSVTYDDQAFKVLTEKGKNANRTISLYYNESYGTAEVLLAQLYKPDGRVVDINVKQLTQVMVDRSQMSSNIFDPHQKITTTTIPNLEVGDTLRFLTRHTTFKPRVPDTFSDYHTFESTQPIVRYAIEINGPKSLQLKNHVIKDRVQDTVSFSKREDGDRVIYKWIAKDVPQAFPEPSMPDLHTVVQRLLVSTIPTWNDVSKWYWNLCEKHLKTSPVMQAKVDELTKGLKSPEDKIRAIFRFVSQEIRYMGITVETEAPGYEPHDVEMTFNNRHGVCRDKAVLLVAMLRLAKLEAFPVLIHAGPLKDMEVPQPYFNHAVTAVLNADGTYTLMDSTDENTKQLFPSYLAHKSFLVARPDGETLKTTPFSPAKDNMLTINAKASIKADGSFEATADILFDGINDNAYRGAFANRTPQQQRQFFERAIKDVAPGAKLANVSIEPKDMLNTEAPLKVTLNLTADTNLFVANDENAMLDIPTFGTSLGIINFVLNSTGLEKRKYPLFTEIACGVQENLTIHIDEAWGLPEVLPQFQNIQENPFLWSKQLGFTPETRELSMRSSFSIDTVQFSPEQYLQLKKHLKAIEVNAQKKAIFKRQPPPKQAAVTEEANVEIILDQTDIALSDENNWTLTHTASKRILSYKGKKAYSELQLSYNPVWEKVTLDYARVITPNPQDIQKSTVKEISQQEINLMDAGWVASAPRYPAGKTLVASLPGVEIGSYIEYKYTVQASKQPFFYYAAAFRGRNPIRKQVVSISAPAHLPLQTAVFQNGYLAATAADAHQDNITETVKTENGRNLWIWTAQNQHMIAQEGNTPPDAAFLPSIQISTGNWGAYTAKIAQALNAQSAAGPAVKQAVKAIRQKYADNLVQGARDFVAQTIRTAGPNFLELPLNVLSSPDTTATQGYGHQADKAILLKAILTELGFQAEYILAANAPQHPLVLKNILERPSPDFFSDLLLKLDVNNQTVWLNDQNQYAQLGTTAYDKCPAITLNGRHLTIAPDKSFEDNTHFDVVITLHDDGSATFLHSTTYMGEMYTDTKQVFAEITPENRRRLIQELVASISQSATLTSDFITDFDSYPGLRKFTCEIKDFAIIDQDYYYFTLPNERFTNAIGRTTDTRKAPLFWNGYRKSKRVIKVIPPPSYTNLLMAPEDFQWKQTTSNGSLNTVKSIQDDKSIVFEYTINLEPDIIPPDQYPAILNLSKQLSHPSMSTVLLKK